MQLDSAAVLPLLLADDLHAVAAPQNTPFSQEMQQNCRMDGALEGDIEEPEKRRICLAVSPSFQDHHVSRHLASLPAGAEPIRDFMIPQTGAQLCRLPHYRLLLPTTDDDLETEEGRRNEAATWGDAYSSHYRGNICVGQMHMHKDTCFKYVIDKAMRFAKHCRFHFCHFVTLFLRGREDDGKKAKSVRRVTLARTGKALVLPRSVGWENTPDLYPVDEEGEAVPLKPTAALGPSVVTDTEHGKHGLVMPIRWNPMEGSSNGPSQAHGFLLILYLIGKRYKTAIGKLRALIVQDCDTPTCFV